MAFEWDRLLETCVRRHATDIFLSPGASPMIRLIESWRSLQIPPVDAAIIQAFVSEQLGQNPTGREEGYAYWDFQHREMSCQVPVAAPVMTRFRATAFGYPATKVLLISRYPGDGEIKGA